MAGEAEARVMSVEGTTTALQTGTGTNLAERGCQRSKDLWTVLGATVSSVSFSYMENPLQ